MAYESELYCPRCDKRITPDHRCLSRRIFLFAGLGELFLAKASVDVTHTYWKSPFIVNVPPGTLAAGDIVECFTTPRNRIGEPFIVSDVSKDGWTITVTRQKVNLATPAHRAPADRRPKNS